jgi:hypothetical protein
MSANGDIFLGLAGAEELMSPLGRTLTISDVEFVRQERTISSTLRKEIINTKVNIKLDFDLIEGPELKRYINFYRLHSELSIILLDNVFDYDAGEVFVYDDSEIITYEEALIQYPELTGLKFQIYKVFMKPLDRTRFLLSGDGLWSGVSVEFEQI